MRVTVVVPRALQRFSEGQKRIAVDFDERVDPVTVASVLAVLAERYPGVSDRTLDERGELRRHVNVFVGDESIRSVDGLATPVRDGVEIAILPAVSGGASP